MSTPKSSFKPELFYKITLEQLPERSGALTFMELGQKNACIPK